MTAYLWVWLAWLLFSMAAVNLAGEAYQHAVVRPETTWSERFSIILRWLFLGASFAGWWWILFVK